MKEKRIVCKVKLRNGGYEYECDDGRKGFCKPSTEGKSGGINIAGFGGSRGNTKPILHCIDKEDLGKKLSEKYKRKVKIVNY